MVVTQCVGEGRKGVVACMPQSNFIWGFYIVPHLHRIDSAVAIITLFLSVSRSDIVQVFSASLPYCPASDKVISTPFQLFQLSMCVSEKACANLYDMQDFAAERCSISIYIVSKMCHAVHCGVRGKNIAMRS